MYHVTNIQCISCIVKDSLELGVRHCYGQGHQPERKATRLKLKKIRRPSNPREVTLGLLFRGGSLRLDSKRCDRYRTPGQIRTHQVAHLHKSKTFFLQRVDDEGQSVRGPYASTIDVHDDDAAAFCPIQYHFFEVLGGMVRVGIVGTDIPHDGGHTHAASRFGKSKWIVAIGRTKERLGIGAQAYQCCSGFFDFTCDLLFGEPCRFFMAVAVQPNLKESFIFQLSDAFRTRLGQCY